MKPFTLEWWLYKLELARMRQSASIFKKNGESKRMMNIANFIHERIIKKYGENK